MAAVFQPNLFQVDVFQTVVPVDLTITSTDILQKPVNCVLAGDPRNNIRAGRLRGPAMRHAFNE